MVVACTNSTIQVCVSIILFKYVLYAIASTMYDEVCRMNPFNVSLNKVYGYDNMC